MSRRARAPKRNILPDPRFNSELLAKFMNMIMVSGKKAVAENVVYGAIDQIADRRKIPADKAVEILEQALENVKPAVEVKSRRVGGATYQVPVEVRPQRRQTLAMRWMIDAARCWTPLNSVARPSRSVKIRTAWPRRTKPSRITAGKRGFNQQILSRN